jgi:hypothetical protein
MLTTPGWKDSKREGRAHTESGTRWTRLAQNGLRELGNKRGLSIARQPRMQTAREALGRRMVNHGYGGLSLFADDRVSCLTGFLVGVLAVVAGLSLSLVAYAGEGENPEDFMQLHNRDRLPRGRLDQGSGADAVLTAKGKTYTGKAQIKSYWQAHPAFQPQTEWVGYTPAFRIRYDVQGDRAHLYFECLWVDKTAGKIAAHTNSDDTLARINGRWLI